MHGVCCVVIVDINIVTVVSVGYVVHIVGVMYVFVVLLFGSVRLRIVVLLLLLW